MFSRQVEVLGVNATKRPCACCDFFGGVGGVGWDVNVPCTSYITCCYAVEISGIVATSHVVTLLMVWSGVGGGMLTFLAFRTLHVATLWRSLGSLLRHMLLRC